MNTLKNIKNNIMTVKKLSLTGSIFAGIFVCVCILGISFPQTTSADYAKIADNFKTITVKLSAYSSNSDQTDDTPFITASGKHVSSDIVANNMLPFGTKIRIPELYGDKIFTVGDRMNKNKSNYHIDLWMPSKPMALNFGIKTAKVEILED